MTTAQPATVHHASNIAEFSQENEKWSLWKEKFNIHLDEIECTDEKIKKSILLKAIGSEAYELVHNVCAPVAPNTKTLIELIAVLDTHYTPAKIIFHERKLFHTATMNETETVSQWYSRIKKLALNCEFGDSLEIMILDTFVTGLPDKIYEKLCEEDQTLTSANALKKALLMETKFATRKDDYAANVNYMKKHGKTAWSKKGNNNNNTDDGSKGNNNNNNKKQNTCKHCGWRTHDSSECRFKKHTCHTCNKVGHLSSVCRLKKEKSNNC